MHIHDISTITENSPKKVQKCVSYFVPLQLKKKFSGSARKVDECMMSKC